MVGLNIRQFVIINNLEYLLFFMNVELIQKCVCKISELYIFSDNTKKHREKQRELKQTFNTDCFALKASPIILLSSTDSSWSTLYRGLVLRMETTCYFCNEQR